MGATDQRAFDVGGATRTGYEIDVARLRAAGEGVRVILEPAPDPARFHGNDMVNRKEGEGSSTLQMDLNKFSSGAAIR